MEPRRRGLPVKPGWPLRWWRATPSLMWASPGRGALSIRYRAGQWRAPQGAPRLGLHVLGDGTGGPQTLDRLAQVLQALLASDFEGGVADHHQTLVAVGFVPGLERRPRPLEVEAAEGRHLQQNDPTVQPLQAQELVGVQPGRVAEFGGLAQGGPGTRGCGGSPAQSRAPSRRLQHRPPWAAAGGQRPGQPTQDQQPRPARPPDPGSAGLPQECLGPGDLDHRVRGDNVPMRTRKGRATTCRRAIPCPTGPGRGAAAVPALPPCRTSSPHRCP